MAAGRLGGRPGLAPLVHFFVVAYAFTWLFWIPAALVEAGRLELPLPVFLLQLLGGLGPMFAAILLTAGKSGQAGVGQLFRQLLRARVGVRWYLAALVLIPLLELPDLLLHAAGGNTLHLDDVVPLLLVGLPLHFLFVALVGGGLDEEMGWRGYALPRLQAGMHPAAASALLGVLWSCWHLPLWFIPGTFQSSQSFPIYLLGVTAMSVLIGWIYNGSGGSLLLAIVAHSASDATDNVRSNLLGVVTEVQATEYHLIRTGLTVIAALLALLLTQGRLGTRESGSGGRGAAGAEHRLEPAQTG